MLVGSLALVGFPYLGAFYSKDLVLEAAYTRGHTMGLLAYVLGVVGALCTSYYSTRLLILVFGGTPRLPKHGALLAHEGTAPLLIPLLVLTTGSIFGAEFLKEAMTGLGSPFWGQALVQPGGVSRSIESEVVPLAAKLAPLVATGIGAGIAWLAHGMAPQAAYRLVTTSPMAATFYTFGNKRWFIDQIYARCLGWASLWVGYNVTFKALDKGVLEITGPMGATALGQWLTKSMRMTSWTTLTHYVSLLAFALILGLLVTLGAQASTVLGWSLTFVEGMGLWLVGAGLLALA
jgi:NADH:ubiquinone oxidoreductase subunit 5 (subunit L)/multisubunit Na+/H+ antiporter MnhA subunit